MADAIAAKATREEKVMRLVEFALANKDDPDFNRLTFPADVLAKLAEHGVKVEPKTYSAAAAIDKCFSMRNTEIYTSNTVEIIDQTGLGVEFPPLPESSSPISTIETKTPESEDSSSPPELDDVSTTDGDAPGPLSECSPEPLLDRTE